MISSYELVQQRKKRNIYTILFKSGKVKTYKGIEILLNYHFEEYETETEFCVIKCNHSGYVRYFKMSDIVVTSEIKLI